MKLIKPSYEILEQSSGLEGIYKAIEIAGRTCYKSLDKITDNSAEGFVNRMIASKHYAMLEHGTVYLKVPNKVVDKGFQSGNNWSTLCGNPYTKCISDGNYYYFTTNYRVIIENNLQEVLEYLCEPTEHHEKRVTVRFTTDRGVSHEFVRHRVFSFAMESTRYCNYSKDKFNNKITFIIPSWMNMEESNVTTDSFGVPVKPSEETCDFLSVLGSAEKNYFRLINKGWKPQQARQILPNALKTELVMTGFVSDWEHFFRLRTSIIAETGNPHPDASALADPLYREFILRNYLEPIPLKNI